MSVTGQYLDFQVRQRVIRPVIAFREYIFRDLLPQFGMLDERAEQIADECYNRMTSEPASDDFDGDISVFAEEANDQALSWYEMMRSLRQTMLNLLAAGLFHLVEQQLASLCRDAAFRVGPPRDTKLEVVTEWYASTLRLDLRHLPAWPMIDELRLVANAAKHAEGPSSGKLRTLRPELFCNPVLAAASDGTGIKDYFLNRAISAPLAGEDLFVSESLLTSYAEGAETFFRQIAEYFDTHADEYY